MPYSLQGRCVIRSDTGTVVKCHPTRAKALRHLAALKINVPEAKAQAEGTAKMSRSEAARHASLVRWKKEQPLAPQTGGMANPAIAARVKEILAEKAAKGKKKGKKAGGKGKGKAKAAAKPKLTAAQKQQAKQQQEAANRAQALSQLRSKPNAASMAALDALSKGEQPDKDMADALADETGLVEKHADGSHTLSAAGHAFLGALGKGDVAGAQEAMAHAGDKLAASYDKEKANADREQAKQARTAAREQAKAERLAQRKKARKAIEDAMTLAIKAGARHSANDMKHIQAAHDSTVMAGATCAPGDSADEANTEEASKAIKGIMDDPGYYAQHECGDVMQACNALGNLCMLLQSELAEEDEDPADVSQLVDAARILVKFIDSELDELEQAAEDDASEDATIGHEPMKAITAREDVNPKAGTAEYGDVPFADMKNKKYPIDTEAHIRAAWNYIGQEKNAAKYDPDEVKQIKAKIVAAWKKKIDEAGPPSAGKAVNDVWLHIDGGEIKAFDDDTIKGLAVLYGTKATPDLEKDYYDKDTDLWLDHWGWPRPITYHHGIDRGTRADPVVGHWTKATVTDEGVWLEGQLDRAHRYYKAIKQLAERGYLKISSDSGPQWVIREPQSNGSNYLKRWPLVTASVTVTPMEPRMLPVEVKAFLAELGVEGIDEDNQEAQGESDDRQDAAKAADERARALSLELDLIELETTL